MAYGDWMPEFQELWEGTPGVSELSGEELDLAEYLFEEGFMHYEGEQSPEDTDFARTQFFDLLGYDYEFESEIFDWDGWREAMGYE